MSFVLLMRDKLAAALQVELAARGVAGGVPLSFAVADRVLADINYEAVGNYVIAATSAAHGYKDGFNGSPPADLADRDAAWAAAGGALADDPVNGQLVAV